MFAVLMLGACATNGSDGSGSSGSSGDGSGSGSAGAHGAHGSMLPAELVGAWQIDDGDAAIRYEFTAQGGVVYASELDTSYGCTYTTKTSFQGSVKLDGNILTITPSDGTQVSDDCGEQTSSPYSKVDVEAYEIQNGTLYMQNQDTGVVLTLTRA
jgi:hypothetical protein